MRKLHTIFGYWDLVILSIHLGLHFKMIFAKLRNKIKDKMMIKILIYILEIVVVILGIRAVIKTNLGAYLMGRASFAIPTSLFLSLLNNLAIVCSISIIAYNLEKIIIKIEGRK